MDNLSPDQYALAVGGKISAHLRQRSPVRYWQTTRQNASRHEAICKADLPVEQSWHVLTFGSHGRFEAAARAKCELVRQFNSHVDTCTNLSLSSLPADWRRAHGVAAGVPGVGYWKWKPYAILKRLRELKENDVLVWADYDLQLGHELRALFCLGANSPVGVVAFHFPCLTEGAWTKREAASELHAWAADMTSVQV